MRNILLPKVIRFADSLSIFFSFLRPHLNSWGTKERFWLTLAPENNTAEFYMVEKVIIWGILNHCIEITIDLHNNTAGVFLRWPIKYL